MSVWVCVKGIEGWITRSCMNYMYMHVRTYMHLTRTHILALVSSGRRGGGGEGRRGGGRSEAAEVIGTAAIAFVIALALVSAFACVSVCVAAAGVAERQQLPAAACAGGPVVEAGEAGGSQRGPGASANNGRVHVCACACVCVCVRVCACVCVCMCVCVCVCVCVHGL